MHLRLSLLLLFVYLLPNAQSLHCLSHSHCGRNAVCVSPEQSAAPTCMCLLGYRGNGRQCVKSSSDLASQFSTQTRGKEQRIVVEKCGDQVLSSSSPPAATLAPSTPRQAPFKVTARPPVVDSSSSSNAFNQSVPCKQVECDFSKGPCSYQNDYYSEWQLREIEGGTILLSTGDAKTEHYLLSGTFRTTGPSFLLFDYFESTSTRGHLSVYSNDLASLVWKASGREPGWTQAVATLPAGRHQVIFAAEKLSAQELVAVTNIRLIGSNGTPAPCS